jgi:hypothetical protein
VCLILTTATGQLLKAPLCAFSAFPEGNVRIWFQNSASVANLLVELVKITTLSRDKLDACKGITQHPNGYVYYGETPEFIKEKKYPYGSR